MTGGALFDRVSERLAPVALGIGLAHGVLSIELPAAEVRQAVQALKEAFGFDLFLDVTAVDWLPQEPRFEVVWHFYSTKAHVRVRLKTRVSGEAPAVDSLVALYGAAHYMERECHDMYGIVFHGNADLRPLLLYEGFVGHPLRKDYPKDREQPLVPFREP